MSPEIWMIIKQISIVVVGLASGYTFTIPVINWFKNKVGFSGGTTLVVVGAFATVITLATAVVDQTLALGSVSPSTWGVMLLAIIAQSHIRYQQIKSDLEKDS